MTSASDQLRVEPILFCFVGPTASGKSTVCRRLLETDPQLKLSVSTTTRAPRPGEKDGVDYHFVSPEEFESRVARGSFFEHAEFSGNRYGTERRNVEAAASSGHDLLLDIEVQGVEQLKSSAPENLIVTFVFPSSFEVLKNRLQKRGTENPEQVNLRLKTAKREIEVLSRPGFADYFLLNDDLESAVRDARAILRVERLRLSRFDQGELAKILK